MRQRNRSDWPVLVYKYRAYLKGVPDFAWEQASMQSLLWNALCQRFDEALSECERLKATSAISTKKERDAYWNQFWLDCKPVVEQSPLDWVAGPDVLDRFQVTARMFLSGERDSKGKPYGPPRPKGLRSGSIRMVNRWTTTKFPDIGYEDPGIPVEKLFGRRSNRFSILKQPPAGAYDDESQENRRRRIVPARFGVGGGRYVDFRLRLHRPMPDGAIVKRVALIGNWEPKPWNREYWAWHVVLWLEIPPRTFDVTHGHRTVAGLDFGWRKFDDYLRIGYIRDSAGRSIELRLPLDMSNYRARRDGLPSSWAEKKKLDAEIARGVDAVKELVAMPLKYTPLPDELRRRLSHIQRMRQTGLRRLRILLSGLSGTEYASAGVDEAVDALSDWDENDRRLRYQVNQLSGRLTRRKDWLYGNLAAWLVKTYPAIVLEGDLDVKEMAENAEGGALKAANRYRQIAAIGQLRTQIQQSAAKYGCTIIDGETAGSTATCSLCGGSIEVGPKQDLVCENGHRMDRSENAARNLLSQIEGDFAQDGNLRTAPSLSVPDELAQVVVPASVAFFEGFRSFDMAADD